MLPQVVGEFRVGVEPNLRFAPSGTAVCSIRAVASSRKKDEGGNWVDDKTTWVDLVGFKKVAENMAESFSKGDLVTVTGKLQVEEWTDNENNKRTSVRVMVDTIGMSVAFNAARSIKADRPASSSGGQSAPAEDPWAQPAGAQSDEPPF
jgi:single-strand DNA-binding protein